MYICYYFNEHICYYLARHACMCILCVHSKPSPETSQHMANALAAVLLHIHIIAYESSYILHQAERCHAYKCTFELIGMQEVDHMHASVLTFAHVSSVVFMPLSIVPPGQLVHCPTDVSQYVPKAHYVCMYAFVYVCMCVGIEWGHTVYVYVCVYVVAQTIGALSMHVYANVCAWCIYTAIAMPLLPFFVFSMWAELKCELLYGVRTYEADMYVCVCVHMYACWMYLYVYGPPYVEEHPWLVICVCVCVCSCIHACICFECIYMYMGPRVCARVGVYMYMYA